MEKISTNLANDLYQLMKQIPKMKLASASQNSFTRSESELLVFLAINVNEDNSALSVSELSSLLQISAAGTTHLLNPLEEADCIERLRDPNDRRVVLVGLTPKGYKIAESMILEFQQKISGLMTYLGEDDSQTLVRLMRLMIEYFTPEQ